MYFLTCIIFIFSSVIYSSQFDYVQPGIQICQILPGGSRSYGYVSNSNCQRMIFISNTSDSMTLKLWVQIIKALQ